MTEGSKRVFSFLKANQGQKLTAQEIAAALDVKVNVVTGSVNGLVKKGYAIREAGEVMAEDGKAKSINYISLTAEGAAFDPDAQAE